MRPMNTAPKDGTEVRIYAPNNRVFHGHWAHGSGNGEQPPFGPAWFKWNGSMYCEIHNPLGWDPL